MKILFVHERLGAFGGAEANIYTTANELKQRGHPVGLLHGPGTSLGEKNWRDLFDPLFPCADSVREAVRQAATEFSPDLLYMHKWSDLAGLSALVSLGLPSVRMVHDHELYCMRRYKYNFLNRRICTRPFSLFCLFPCGAFFQRQRRRWWLPLQWISYPAKRQELRLNRHFHRLVVASQYMAGELTRNGFPPNRIAVHPPVTSAGDASFSSNFSDRNRIMFVGQIIRGKGVDVLLECLAQLTEPFECLIFGDGNHRSYCEKLSRKLGLTSRVRFMGFVSQAELRQYYREASVLVVSSVWPEPFGATGLEGMAHGLPVVAFEAGGIREWLTDGVNGFLVPWMDRTRFAARVQELLLDKTLARRLGENARQWVREGHTLDKYVGGLEHLFSEVVNEVREPAHP